MKRYGYLIIAFCMLLCSTTPVTAGVSIGIGLPNVSIGINLPIFPELVPVPGYPVYYAPGVEGNYFFYDGMYWVYQENNWYASTWYNGPWGFVEPVAVPVFVLRIPVRYYQRPPAYFHGWQSSAPPRWGQHWGRHWEQQRKGWDRWNRKTVTKRAPQPAYQRQYTGSSYPGVEHQEELRSQKYRYQPQDKVVRQHLQRDNKRGSYDDSSTRSRREPDEQHTKPHQMGAPADPHSQPPQRGGEFARKPGPDQHPPERQDPRLHELEQRTQENSHSPEPNRGQGRSRDDGRGRDRNKQ